MADVRDLIGKVLSKVENKDDSEIVFTSTDGSVWRMFHSQES